MAEVVAVSGVDAARELIERYAERVDAADAAGVVALFAADGSLQTSKATFDGREAIAGFYGDRLTGGKLHLVTDIRVTPVDPETGGELAARSRFVALVGTPDQPELTWGTYEDRIVVGGGEARFKVRRITIDAAGPVLDAWTDLVRTYRGSAR